MIFACPPNSVYVCDIQVTESSVLIIYTIIARGIRFIPTTVLENLNTFLAHVKSPNTTPFLLLINLSDVSTRMFCFDSRIITVEVNTTAKWIRVSVQYPSENDARKWNITRTQFNRFAQRYPSFLFYDTVMIIDFFFHYTIRT